MKANMIRLVCESSQLNPSTAYVSPIIFPELNQENQLPNPLPDDCVDPKDKELELTWIVSL